MKRTEIHRIDVISKANAGVLTVKEAAEYLGVSERQIKRLKKQAKEGGVETLIHGNRGRQPAHSLSAATKAKIIELRRSEIYSGSNFEHFKEILEEYHEIKISYSSLYNVLRDAGIKSPKTRRRYKPHRRRNRRPQAGMLLQTDATPFSWFRGDKRKYALHGAIDDATGQITGLYMTQNECMQGYFEMLRRTIANYGVPQSLYADRHTIFQSPNRAKEEIDPSIPINDTQLGRSLKELSIELIQARSPQAKGRVERLWETLQGRLPTDFAINNITTIDAANEFLERYIYTFNSIFAVEPKDADNAFSKLPEGVILDNILCIKETRNVDAGGIFSYGGKQFKVTEDVYSGAIPPNAKVSVLLSPYFGMRVQYRGIIYDTTRTIKPKSSKSKASDNSQPTTRPRSSAQKRAVDDFNNGKFRVHYVETDAEIMDMLYDIFLKELPSSASSLHYSLPT